MSRKAAPHRTRFFGQRFSFAPTATPDWEKLPKGAPSSVHKLSSPWNCCATGRRTKYRIGPCKRPAWFSIEDGNPRLGTRMRFPMCAAHLRSLLRYNAREARRFHGKQQ